MCRFTHPLTHTYMYTGHSLCHRHGPHDTGMCICTHTHTQIYPHMFEACLQHPCHLNINPCPNTQACTYVYLLGPQITRDTYVHKSTCQGHIGTHMITLPWSFKAVALNRWQMMHSHTHTNICSFRGVCTCMQVNKNTHAIQLHSAHTHTHTCVSI